MAVTLAFCESRLTEGGSWLLLSLVGRWADGSLCGVVSVYGVARDNVSVARLNGDLLFGDAMGNGAGVVIIRMVLRGMNGVLSDAGDLAAEDGKVTIVGLTAEDGEVTVTGLTVDCLALSSSGASLSAFLFLLSISSRSA